MAVTHQKAGSLITMNLSSVYNLPSILSFIWVLCGEDCGEKGLSGSCSVLVLYRLVRFSWHIVTSVADISSIPV